MELHSGSEISVSSSVDLFSLPPSDVTSINSEVVTFYPIGNFKQNQNPLQFVINSPPSHYLDVSSARIYLQAKIVKQDGGTLLSSDDVAPTFNFLPSLFSSCEVLINGHQVERCPDYYAYRHAVQDILCFPPTAKATALNSQVFIADSKQQVFNSSDDGYTVRRNLAKDSKLFEVSGRIASGIFAQNRWLPHPIELKVTLRRSPPEFSLVSIVAQTGACPYKVEFEKVELRITKHEINPSVLQQHERHLNSGKRLQFPTRTHEVSAFNVAKDTLNVTSSTLFSGVLPETLIFCMVDSEAMLGKLSKTCFKFDPNELQSITVTVNGETTLWRELNFDLNNNIYLQGYETLFSACGEQGNGITHKDYTSNGLFFVVLDINPHNKGNKFLLPHTGQLQISLRFKTALTKSITCLAIGQFQYLIQVDKNGQTYSDALLQK